MIGQSTTNGSRDQQSGAERDRQQWGFCALSPKAGSTDRKQRKSERNFSYGGRPAHPRSKCPTMKAKCFKCGKDGHYSSVCRSKKKRSTCQWVTNVVGSSPADCIPDEHEPIYFNVHIHHPKTVTIEGLNYARSEPQVCPLWISQESSSQVFQIVCEVDTGASCDIWPLPI